MLIKWGSIVVDGSGKLGGHVFSKSRGGATVRTLARADNPQTSFQQNIRSRFTELSQGWSLLSESQRESWYRAESSFSRTNRFGDIVFLSGKNLYNSLNAQRAIIGLDNLLIAPIPQGLNKSFISSAYIRLSENRIFINGRFSSSAQYVIVGTPALSQGTKFVKNSIRILGLGMSNANGDNISTFDKTYSDYVARFQTPIDGQKIFIGVYTINESGQRSSMSTVPARFIL